MMVNRFCVARCCCGGTPPSFGCNPEGIVYPASGILDDTGITVDSDYLNFFVGSLSKTSGYPFSPSATFTPNGFGGFNQTNPAGSWYNVETANGGRIDFDSYANSATMYGYLYGTSASVDFQLDRGTTTGTDNLWNPCDKNTLTLSLSHARDVNAPSGGWPVDINPAASSGSLTVSQSGTSPDPVEVKYVIGYDKTTGDYENYIAVVEHDGTETEYPFGTSTTTSADLDIGLIITPVEPTVTSPVRNRWKMEFDITCNGTSLTIPSYEFELTYGASFAVGHSINMGTNAADHDKYTVSDVSIALSDTVIP